MQSYSLHSNLRLICSKNRYYPEVERSERFANDRSVLLNNAIELLRNGHIETSYHYFNQIDQTQPLKETDEIFYKIWVCLKSYIQKGVFDEPEISKYISEVPELHIIHLDWFSKNNKNDELKAKITDLGKQKTKLNGIALYKEIKHYKIEHSNKIVEAQNSIAFQLSNLQQKITTFENNTKLKIKNAKFSIEQIQNITFTSKKISTLKEYRDCYLHYKNKLTGSPYDHLLTTIAHEYENLINKYDFQKKFKVEVEDLFLEKNNRLNDLFDTAEIYIETEKYSDTDIEQIIEYIQQTDSQYYRLFELKAQYFYYKSLFKTFLTLTKSLSHNAINDRVKQFLELNKVSVFISHSSKDLALVEAFISFLKFEGVGKVIIDRSRLSHSENIEDKLRKLIKDKTNIVFLLASQNSLTSEWVGLELAQADAEKIDNKDFLQIIRLDNQIDWDKIEKVVKDAISNPENNESKKRFNKLNTELDTVKKIIKEKRTIVFKPNDIEEHDIEGLLNGIINNQVRRSL